MNEKHLRLLRYALFAFLTGLIVLLHTWGLGAKALWYDEVSTIIFSSKSFGELWEFLLKNDVHPPLFFFLEGLMLDLPIPDEWSVRLLPLAASLGAVVVTELIVRRLYGVRWVGGILAGAFPGLVVYGQEARAYAILAFLQLVAFYGVLKVSEAESRRVWIAVTVVALWLSAGMHYLSIIYIIPLLVALIAVTPTKRSVFLGLTLLVGAALYFPWLDRAVTTFLGDRSSVKAFEPLDVGLRALFDSWVYHWGGTVSGSLALVLMILSVAVTWRKRMTWVVVSIFLAYLAFFAFVPLKFGFFSVRYILAWAVLGLVLIPGGISRLQGRWRVAASAGLVVLILPLFLSSSIGHVTKEQVWNRELAEFVIDEFDDGDALVITPFYQATALYYYLPLETEDRELLLTYNLPATLPKTGEKHVAVLAPGVLPGVVGYRLLSGRFWVLAVGGGLPSPFNRWKKLLTEVKRWNSAALYKFSEPLHYNPDTGMVHYGQRPLLPATSFDLNNWRTGGKTPFSHGQ